MRVDTSGRATRRSQIHQQARITTPPAAVARVRGDAQPHSLPWVIVSSTAVSPAASPSAPSQSIEPVALRGRFGTSATTSPITSTVNPVVSQNTRW